MIPLSKKKVFLEVFLTILIIGGLGFSFLARASNDYLGNVKFGSKNNLFCFHAIAKTNLTNFWFQGNLNVIDLFDRCASWYKSSWRYTSGNIGNFSEGEKIENCFASGDWRWVNEYCEASNPGGNPTVAEMTSADNFAFYVFGQWDETRYYWLGALASRIEILEPEEEATITVDILTAKIEYNNFDNFDFINWWIDRYENATWTFWEEGVSTADEGLNQKIIEFYPLRENKYYRLKFGLTDGDIAEIWTDWRYFTTLEFEFYPPAEPETWLPIDKEQFYIEHRGEASPTIAWLGTTDAIDTIFNPVGTWIHFFSGFFDKTELHDLTADINSKINLVRSYLNFFDNFFGGFPVALIFGLFVVVLVGKIIFNLTTKLIDLIKP